MISLKVIIYLMTARVSLLSVTGNTRGPVNIICDNTPVNQTAYQGSFVTITCKYARAENDNIKSFCREVGNFNCTNLISTYTSNYTIKERFSLRDNKLQGVYNVTISSLTLDDTGRYQCAMKSLNKSTECLTQIHLHVLDWDKITPTEISRNTGENVRINCSYPDSHEKNEKFLCKGKSPLNCEELIHTTTTNHNNNRFFIRDTKRKKYFFVNIKNVSTADSGMYWCGSDKTWQHAKHISIFLSVDEKHSKTKRSEALNTSTSKPSMTTGNQSNKEQSPQPLSKGLIAGVVVCVALLLILAVLLILYRHKLPRTQVCCAAGGSSEERTDAGHNTEGNHGDHHYDEIAIRTQQASSGNAIPSVYATVNPAAYHLHYASVNFKMDSKDGNALPDTDKTDSSACEYSSISGPQGATHRPAAEQTLYSTVTMPGEP